MELTTQIDKNWCYVNAIIDFKKEASHVPTKLRTSVFPAGFVLMNAHVKAISRRWHDKYEIDPEPV